MLLVFHFPNVLALVFCAKSTTISNFLFRFRPLPRPLPFSAGFANFASKTDEDVGDVVQNLSKTTLEVYNYFVKLDNKYALLNKAQSALQKSYDQLKESGGDPEALEKVEKALADTTGKINEVNEEYDVVGAGLQALGIVGDVTEKAVKKTIELNAEYKLTDKALDAIQKAIEKVKASA